MSNEELVELYQNGDKNALDKLIENNKGIVHKIANKYNNINEIMELEDLIQEGILGVMKAAKTYNLYNENRAKFITYAFHYINRYIYSCANGRGTREEGNNKFYGNCTSINVPVGEKGETKELGDLIESVDYGFENIEEKIYIEQLRNQIEGAMNQCNTLEEREILKLRYGWNFKPITLYETGEIFNITGERVRQKEYIALRKLRDSNWARVNAKEFVELGYINDFYLGIFRNRGIDI